MDDSAWPSVPWTEYLNGDFEDDYTAVYRIVDQALSPFTGLNCDGEVHPGPDESCPVISVEAPSCPPPRKSRQVFSAEAHRTVKEWLGNHADDPYPTAAEKDHFAQSLGLSSKQISTLFNNIRKRHTEVNPTLGKIASTSLPPVAIATSPKIDEDDTPMSRYLSSSPEEDPQPMELVAKAAVTLNSGQASTVEVDGSSGAKKKRKLSGSQNGSRFDTSSHSDALSSHSSEQSGSGSSCTSGKKGKRRTIIARLSTAKKGRYYCTYCWKNFASSGTWRKHEESIHKPQKEIECRMSDLNPTLMDCSACVGTEAGCQQGLNHNYKACLKRTKETRTFHRTDHFKKHLSGIHNAMFTPAMNNWIQPTSNNSKSRCGFCLKWFPTWTDRLDHIGNHYRFHDDFDKSKWRLDGDGDEEMETVEAIAEAKKSDNGNESSALVKHQKQTDLRLEVNSFLDDYFSRRAPSGISLSNYGSLVDWESLGLWEIRGLDELHTVVLGKAGGTHYYDCPALFGGECKFDILENSYSGNGSGLVLRRGE